MHQQFRQEQIRQEQIKNLTTPSGGGWSPSGGDSTAGGGDGQSPTGSDVAGTPFNKGGRGDKALGGRSRDIG